jgi:xanthine/uracil permease
MAIISKGVPFNRRNRFILTAGLAIGYGATLVPTYFSHVFTYSGDNKGLQGFLDAIVLIMETGFAVTAIICMALNLGLPDEIEETTEQELNAGPVGGDDNGFKGNARSLDSDEIRPVEERNAKQEEKV